MDSQPGSSAQWDAADRVLFSWLDQPIERIEERLVAMAHRDPAMADALRSRLGQLRRLGVVGEAASTHTPSTGRTFGGYEIERLLGTGGMGSVYLATQKSPRRQVALKVIRADRLGDPAARDRFQREARAVATLRDPGICAVLEVGEAEGTPFLAMQYIEGQTLAERLAAQRAHAGKGEPSSRGPRTPADIGSVVTLVERVARSLHVAHEAGVVHRDVKPGNLMIDQKGEPVVLDFGLAHVAKAGDEATLTRTGDVLGTPAYMSPEQLRPTKGGADRRTDVYSLAATLFECLTLVRPFAGSSEIELYERILRDPTPDPRRHNPHLPSDVGSVIGKAMEKDPARRYATAAEFADDLARLVRREPVRARRVGAFGRAWRWSQRHPVGATLIAVLGTSVVITSRLLQDSMEKQTKITAVMQDLSRRTDEFETLSTVVQHDNVVEIEKSLNPPWPEQIARMERWLDHDAKDLLAKRKEIEVTLADLRVHALPPSPGQAVDPTQHPRHAEWLVLQARVEALARAQRLRSGKETLQLPELLPLEKRGPAIAKATAGWAGVAPDRTTFGNEALGLAFARGALANLDAGDTSLPRSMALNFLAWALAANGQDAEARARMDEAVQASPPLELEYWQERRRQIETMLVDADAELERLQQRLRALTDEVNRTYRFDRKSEQHLHDELVRVLPKLAVLESVTCARVQRRLEWARRIDKLTTEHPNAPHSWAEAAAAIAKADGEAASSLYRVDPIPELKPQTGLVPIGKNPKTGLWEFYDLRSAYDGVRDPSAIAIPRHRPDGTIDVRIDTGIVFVLVPGGTFTMGAQRSDPDAPNYDPDASLVEGPPHPVTLAPFFLARHEMTQGQWLRLSGGEAPSMNRFGMVMEGEQITQANPVETVDWNVCTALLTNHGMLLPTEAQWEYACRAGTATPWSCDREDLGTHGNLADQALGTKGYPGVESWNDGRIGHARVGSYAANEFGMFDMHGNVAEWCRDAHGNYSGPVQAGDGLRLVHDANRVRRGGEWQGPAITARSSARVYLPPKANGNRMGLRAARAVAR